MYHSAVFVKSGTREHFGGGGVRTHDVLSVTAAVFRFNVLAVVRISKMDAALIEAELEKLAAASCRVMLLYALR